MLTTNYLVLTRNYLVLTRYYLVLMRKKLVLTRKYLVWTWKKSRSKEKKSACWSPSWTWWICLPPYSSVKHQPKLSERSYSPFFQGGIATLYPPSSLYLSGGESKGNFSEEPTCTRTTFQGAHTQGLGKCMIFFHSKGIMSN